MTPSTSKLATRRPELSTLQTGSKFEFRFKVCRRSGVQVWLCTCSAWWRSDARRTPPGSVWWRAAPPAGLRPPCRRSPTAPTSSSLRSHPRRPLCSLQPEGNVKLSWSSSDSERWPGEAYLRGRPGEKLPPLLLVLLDPPVSAVLVHGLRLETGSFAGRRLAGGGFYLLRLGRLFTLYSLKINYLF